MAKKITENEVDENGNMTPRRRAKFIIDTYRDSIIRGRANKIDLEVFITREIVRALKEAKQIWKEREKALKQGGSLPLPEKVQETVNLDDIFTLSGESDSPKKERKKREKKQPIPEVTLIPTPAKKRGRPAGSKNKER